MVQLNFKLKSHGCDNVYTTGLLNEYDQILLGNQKKFSGIYFSFAENVNETMALTVFKYALERYLKWSPAQAYSMLSAEIIKQMHLTPLLTHIHSFPVELNRKSDLWYIVHRIYPHVVPLNQRLLITSLMSRIIENKTAKFPEDYFFSDDGDIKACVCLQYVLEQYLIFKDIADMYKFFSDTTLANKSLQQYSLLNVYKIFYETPLDYLHASLPDSQKDDFLYHYYTFTNKFNKA